MNVNIDSQRKGIIEHYSQYSFLRSMSNETLINNVTDPIKKGVESGEIEEIKIVVGNHSYFFYVKYLKWDTEYFNQTTYKLLLVTFDNDDYLVLKEACSQFVKLFFSSPKYCFSEIPSEDIKVIQALNEAGFKLVENRLTYYLDLKSFTNDRFQTRSAELSDIPNLMRVAREMRNDYDRFHSDNVYDSKIADEFLATYIEQSVKGFADYTILPNEEGIEPDAFVTAKYLKEEWVTLNEKISIMVLSAVSSKTCKGWYVKLISEMAYHLRSIGADYAFMHPATTNRAVIHSYEKLGCKYGKCIHVLTYKS